MELLTCFPYLYLISLVLSTDFLSILRYRLYEKCRRCGYIRTPFHFICSLPHIPVVFVVLRACYSTITHIIDMMVLNFISNHYLLYMYRVADVLGICTTGSILFLYYSGKLHWDPYLHQLTIFKYYVSFRRCLWYLYIYVVDK